MTWEWQEIERRLREIPDDDTRDTMTSAIDVFVHGTQEERDRIKETCVDEAKGIDAIKAELVKMDKFYHWIF